MGKLKYNLLAIVVLISLLIALYFINTVNNKEILYSPILYSWHMESIDDDKFYDTLDSLSIKELYQHFDSTFFEENNATFFNKMYEKNIKVFHLCGDPSWGINNSDKIKKEIDKVYNYNSSNDFKISGIVLDIESYSQDLFDKDKYLLILKDAYKYAKEKDVYVIIDIPVWFDKYGDYYLEDLIKNCCDEISIMNYNIKRTISNIEKEIKYTNLYNKAVSTIYEINFDNKNYFPSYDSIYDDYQKITNYYNSKIKIAYHHYDSIIK